MNSHVYEFAGNFYLQLSGGPIGLRATCAVARVVMNYWDRKWRDMMNKNNINRDLEDRYMDDIRIVLMAINHGWRWKYGGLHYCETWKQEDILACKTSEDVTSDAIIDSMNDTLTFLKFTKEMPSDFPDQKLPTLDLKTWLLDGKLVYEFYEKPMCNNVVVHAKSALGETVKSATLTEHVMRRLKNTSQALPISSRLEALENLCQKMVNSEHKTHFIKRILATGITKYERKVKASKLDKSNPRWRPLHQPSGRSLTRLKKKARAREDWYKVKEDED